MSASDGRDAPRDNAERAAAKPPEPPDFRVYINERGVSVPTDATALDAVRAYDQAVGGAEADAIVAGTRRLTDSRGLAVDSNGVVWGGAIFRIVTVRESPPDAGNSPSEPSGESSTASSPPEPV